MLLSPDVHIRSRAATLPRLMRLATTFFVVATALLVTTLSGSAEAMDRLLIGLLPGESAPEIIRQNEALRTYLERELGMPVELFVGTDYAATGEAIRFGRVDIAYLGPVTYVLQSRKADLEPFARPEHEHGSTFKALIIAPAGSATNLDDLRGKQIAFGDPASTSGHWVPRHMLLGEELVAARDYQPVYLGSHDAVAKAVERGNAAAGGISEPIFRRLVSEGKIDGSKVEVVGVSEDIPEYSWVFRPGFDPALKEKVRQAFLSITDPVVLKTTKAVRYIPSSNSDYDIVRSWIDDIERYD